MTYGNFSTGSLGYQDMTILRINRKANAERNGPKIPIASLAVAGSKSASKNVLLRSEVTTSGGMLSLMLVSIPAICGGSLKLDGKS